MSNRDLTFDLHRKTRISEATSRLERPTGFLSNWTETTALRNARTQLDGIAREIAIEVVEEQLQQQKQAAVMQLGYRGEEIAQMLTHAHNQKMDELLQRAIASAMESVMRVIAQGNELQERLEQQGMDEDLREFVKQQLKRLIRGNVKRTLAQNCDLTNTD